MRNEKCQGKEGNQVPMKKRGVLSFHVIRELRI